MGTRPRAETCVLAAKGSRAKIGVSLEVRGDDAPQKAKRATLEGYSRHGTYFKGSKLE
jgi:hypothetical protein